MTIMKLKHSQGVDQPQQCCWDKPRLLRELRFILSTVLLAVTLFLAPGCDDDDDDGNDTRVDLQLVADGMASPIGLVAAPDNTNRLFVIDQAGKVWIIDASGTRLPTPFIDVTSMMVTLNP